MTFNVLITGANGQLGNEFKKLSMQSPVNYIFTDLQELDITNKAAIKEFFKAQQINYVVNCAAYTNVDKAESDIENAYLVNSIGPKNLMEICQKNFLPLIHISTDYVFDGKSSIPYREESPTNPINIYGKSKLEGEQNIVKYEKSLILRTSWLYSTYGNNFVKTILKLAKEKDSIEVVYDQIGSPTYAEDLALFIDNLLQKNFKSGYELTGIYHFSNEGVCSWYDFAIQIIKQIHSKTKIKPIQTEKLKRPAQRPHFSVLDKQKIKEKLQIEIPHWTESLEKCLKNLLE